MTTYTPRPGSKTEAVIEYIRAQGGQALAVDIADALDTDRKNLPATLKAAINNGLLEPWDLPAGGGYCLCGNADKLPGAPRPARERKATDKERLPGAGTPAPEAATEIRPYLGKMPKATPPKKPRKPKAAQVNVGQGEEPGAMVSAALLDALMPKPGPVGGGAPVAFRVGEFSDGSLRLEGLPGEMNVCFDADQDAYDAVTLSPAAAAVLIEFLDWAAPRVRP